MIIAHRGHRKKGEPDNSMPAFHSAIDSKADGFEFDIQLTSDRKFVCFHDDTLEILGMLKPINEVTFEEVVSLKLADDVHIPSLEDVLTEFSNKVFLNIELKPKDGGVEELIELINKYKLKKDPSNFIISSFNFNALRRIKSLDSDVPTGLLVHFVRNQLERAVSINCDAIHPFFDMIPDGWSKLPKRVANYANTYYINKCITEATKIGMFVSPYTVNHELYQRKSFQKGVFSVITDEVERAWQIRKNSLNLFQKTS